MTDKCDDGPRRAKVGGRETKDVVASVQQRSEILSFPLGREDSVGFVEQQGRPTVVVDKASGGDVRTLLQQRIDAALTSMQVRHLSSATITRDGVFLEQLEVHPELYLPKEAPAMVAPVKIDLSIGMDRVRAILSKFPVDWLTCAST